MNIKEFLILDDKVAIDSLIGGFIDIFGVKHKEFIEDISNEVINISKTNGELWTNDCIKNVEDPEDLSI